MEMQFKLLACLSGLLSVLAIVHGGLTLAAGRDVPLAGVAISSGLSALMVLWLANRKRRA
jgi:cytochrome P450